MNVELPEHLRTGPLADAAAKSLADAASMAAASQSVPRISLRGREFRLVEGGEEIAKFRDKLDVVIFGVEPDAGLMIKTYYKDGYKQGSKEPPTCSSDDGISPSPWVTDRQSPTCRTCSKNTFGSATSPSGKPTKACRDSKRAWLVIADGNVDSANKPFEVKPVLSERTLFGLNVTVASLKAFSDHGRKLAQLGQGPAVCVTRVIMKDTEFPQLDFELSAWLDAEKAPQSLKISSERPWKIQYANAGPALAAPDSGGSDRVALPMQVPDHLKNPQSSSPTVQQAEPRVTASQEVASAKVVNVDDEISKW